MLENLLYRLISIRKNKKIRSFRNEFIVRFRVKRKFKIHIYLIS